MLVIRDAIDRKEWWCRFWAELGSDVDTLPSPDVYPLHPTAQYVVPGMKLLDCGCGMGRVIKHYRAVGHPVVGMDYEPACVARLHAERPDLSLYVGDVHDLPHPPETFDAVLAFGTLSNVPDPSRPLREVHRVLRPGGLLVASVTQDSVLRRVLTHAGALRGGRRQFAMVAYTRREWRRILEGHGFSVVEVAPVVTRLPMYTFFPFFRASRGGTLQARVVRYDRGLRLNPVGDWVFKTAFRYCPFVVSHGVVAVARRDQR